MSEIDIGNRYIGRKININKIIHFLSGCIYIGEFFTLVKHDDNVTIHANNDTCARIDPRQHLKDLSISTPDIN